MNEDDRRELEMYRQWMDMRVYVTDNGKLVCGFTGCACIADGHLGLPMGMTDLFDVAQRIMEHRVDNLIRTTQA